MPSFDPSAERPARGDYVVRNDGAHREAGTAPGASPADGPAADDLYDSPAYILAVGDPVLTDQLSAIDDLVFEAIAGKAAALGELRRRWLQMPELVGEALFEESRQAYLRHALNQWRECDADEDHRNPRLAATLLDVLEILLP